jgi:hypothetical protein
MSEQCLDYWEPVLGALDAIIAHLPRETQKAICEHLQALSKVQADRGMLTASCFSRCLSGEAPPHLESPVDPHPHLKLVVAN